MKTVVGLSLDAAPKTVVTSCGVFFTGPHAKQGLANISNIEKMNQVTETSRVINVKSTGWPIPVAYSVESK
ncbi:MAG: hypothetical protein H9W81_13690 [Enterococcus sp.]|nr:hypothetical protein [Enterococcus sp.]